MSDDDTDERDRQRPREITGRISFRWLDGGFFLVQDIDLDHAGEAVTGIEIIGYDASSGVCTSHYFDNAGNAFEHAWDVADETLEIGLVGFLDGISTTSFEGSVESASFEGKFGDGGDTITGRREWPGGGYAATLTRVT